MSKSKVKDRRSDASVKRSSISELAGKVSFLICGNQYDMSLDRAQDLAGASSTSHIIGLLSPTRTRHVNTGDFQRCKPRPQPTCPATFDNGCADERAPQLY